VYLLRSFKTHTHTHTHTHWCIRVQVKMYLARELEQHRVVEEFVDGNILAHALAAPRLDHEFAREIVCGLWLEGTQHDRLVKGVSRYDRPMIEHLFIMHVNMKMCVYTHTTRQIYICVYASKLWVWWPNDRTPVYNAYRHENVCIYTHPYIHLRMCQHPLGMMAPWLNTCAYARDMHVHMWTCEGKKERKKEKICVDTSTTMHTWVCIYSRVSQVRWLNTVCMLVTCRVTCMYIYECVCRYTHKHTCMYILWFPWYEGTTIEHLLCMHIRCIYIWTCGYVHTKPNTNIHVYARGSPGAMTQYPNTSARFDTHVKINMCVYTHISIHTYTKVCSKGTMA